MFMFDLVINSSVVKLWISCYIGDEHRSDIDESKVKAPNMFERAKEEIDAVIGAIHQRKSSRFCFFFCFSLSLSNSMTMDQSFNLFDFFLQCFMLLGTNLTRWKSNPRRNRI